MAFTCNFWSRSLLKLFFLIFRFIPWFCCFYFSVCFVWRECWVFVSWMMIEWFFCLFHIDFAREKILGMKLGIVYVCVLGVNVLLLCSVVVAVKGLVLCNACYFFFLLSVILVCCLFTFLLNSSSSFVCLLLLRRLDQVDDLFKKKSGSYQDVALLLDSIPSFVTFPSVWWNWFGLVFVGLLVYLSFFHFRFPFTFPFAYYSSLVLFPSCFILSLLSIESLN